MPIRQQPSRNNRRKVTRANPGRPDDIRWLPVEALDTQITFNLSVAAQDCVVVGVPRIQINYGAVATSIISFVSTTLVLGYGSVPEETFTLSVSTWDGALRSKWGGYLGMAQTPMMRGDWPPVLPRYDWTVTDMGGFTRLQFLGSGVGQPLTTSVPGLRRLFDGEYPMYAVDTGSGWDCTYITPSSPGDEFELTGTVADNIVWVNRGWPVAGVRIS